MEMAAENRGTCVTNSTAGSAYGAMLLAGAGTGVWKTAPEACAATIKIIRRTRKTARRGASTPLGISRYGFLNPGVIAADAWLRAAFSSRHWPQ